MDYNGDFWADHDEDCHGEVDTDQMRKESPHGFIWTCCNIHGGGGVELGKKEPEENVEGCNRGPYLSRTELGGKRQLRLKMRQDPTPRATRNDTIMETAKQRSPWCQTNLSDCGLGKYQSLRQLPNYKSHE